jgi:putative membrane protein
MLTLVLPGVKITGGIPTYILGGVALSLMFLIIKPILSIITLPLNFITLGSFSFFINVIILYLLTVFVSSISINSFAFNGLKFAGFVIPKLYVNTFFSFVLASLLLSLIFAFLTWLIKK